MSEAKLFFTRFNQKFTNCHQNANRLNCNGYDGYWPATTMSGLQFPETKKAFEMLPHYAYLMFDFNRPHIWRTRLDPSYGNVIAVFKDSIKDQVTFSTGNSWVIRDGVQTLDYNTLTPFPVPNYELEYGQSRLWGHHWKAQTWGLLELKDVDYFILNCPVFGEASQKALEELRSSVIPVFRCINDPQNSEIRKGERLF